MTETATFSTSSLDWARGVEYGLLFARIKYGARVATYPVHSDLAQSAQRLADLYGFGFRSDPHEHGDLCAECIGRDDCKDGQGWLDITFSPRRSPRRRRGRSAAAS
jgi:hypothetical protein